MVPLWILSFFAVFAGFLNAAFGIEKFEPSGSNRGFAESRRSRTAAFNVDRATLGDRRRCSARVVWAYYKGKLPQGLSERNTLGGARASSSSSTSTTSTAVRDIIVGRHQGPDRAGRVLVQPERHRQRPQLHGSRRAQALGRVTYDVHRSEGRRRRGERHRARSPATPATKCARSRPVACSSTHSCSSSRGAFSPSRSGSSR